MIDEAYLICPECGNSAEYCFVDWYGQGDGDVGEMTVLYHDWSFTPPFSDGFNRMHCEANCPFCNMVFRVDLILNLDEFTSFQTHIHRVAYFRDEAEEQLRREMGIRPKRFSLPSGGFSLPTNRLPAPAGRFSLSNRRSKT